MQNDYIPVYELHPQRNSTSPINNPHRVLDIVFFHGLQLAGRHSAWETTWTNSRGKCWPRDWLPHHPDLTGMRDRVRVLSVSYNAQLSGHATGKFGRTAHSHASISAPMFHALVTRWSVGTVPFVLVGHSYGGLVIKSLVVHCNHNARNPDAANFLQNLRGVVSYGVPHGGSNLAAHAIRANSCLPLRLSRLVHGLRPFNLENQALSGDFRIALQSRGFGGAGVKRFAFAEALETNGVMVVPQASAQGDHIDDDFLVLQQTDHYSMCKPNDRGAEAYVMFIQFLVRKIIAADSALEDPGTRPLGSAPPVYERYRP